jgi:hypothetical protein
VIGIAFLAGLDSGGVGILFVDQNASHAVADGLSWETAFRSVGAALAAAREGDEVWVAQGVYPERIVLRSGVELYGGFAGAETNRTGRDWMRHPTILDGSLGLSDWERLEAVPPASVVRIPAGATAHTRLDGFTVINGTAGFGAAVYIEGGSPVVANNTIVTNVASGIIGGGGILCLEPIG